MGLAETKYLHKLDAMVILQMRNKIFFRDEFLGAPVLGTQEFVGLRHVTGIRV